MRTERVLGGAPATAGGQDTMAGRAAGWVGRLPRDLEFTSPLYSFRVRYMLGRMEIST